MTAGNKTVTVIPGEVTIASYTYRDLVQLEALFSEGFGNEYNLPRIKKQLQRVRQFYLLFRPASLLFTCANNLFNTYVCRIAGQTKGFIQISRLNDRQIHIDYIGVAEDCRGRGLGSALLRYVIEHLYRDQPVDFVLEVYKDSPACRMYEKFGFIVQNTLLRFELRPDSLRRLTDQGLLADVAAPGLVKIQGDNLPMINSVPSWKRLITRGFDAVKNMVMGNEKQYYVLQKAGQILAALHIYSYPQEHLHIIDLAHGPAHRYLRGRLLLFALSRIIRYPAPTVVVTMVNEDDEYRGILERLGFQLSDFSYRMIRPYCPGNTRSVRI